MKNHRAEAQTSEYNCGWYSLVNASKVIGSSSVETKTRWKESKNILWPGRLTNEARVMWPEAYLEWRIGGSLPEADVLIGLMRFPGNVFTQSHWLCLVPEGKSNFLVLDSSDGSSYRMHRDCLGLAACLGITPEGYEPDLVGGSLINVRSLSALLYTPAWDLGNWNAALA